MTFQVEFYLPSFKAPVMKIVKPLTCLVLLVAFSSTLVADDATDAIAAVASAEAAETFTVSSLFALLNEINCGTYVYGHHKLWYLNNYVPQFGQNAQWDNWIMSIENNIAIALDKDEDAIALTTEASNDLVEAAGMVVLGQYLPAKQKAQAAEAKFEAVLTLYVDGMGNAMYRMWAAQQTTGQFCWSLPSHPEN